MISCSLPSPALLEFPLLPNLAPPPPWQRFIFDFRQLHSGGGQDRLRGLLSTTAGQRPPLLLSSLQTADTEALLRNPV